MRKLLISLFKKIRKKKSLWFVYIVECTDGTYYTGITKDLDKRVNEHNKENGRGAKYTRSRRPVILVYSERSRSRSEATKRELEIKKMNIKRKISLFL